VRWTRGSVVAGPVVTVVLSVVVLVQAMKLWEWTPGTPLGLNGDNVSVTTWVRTIIEYGPYADNPRLGAPFSQNLGWYPTADDVHFLALWLLGRISDNAFTVTALYFFIGFPLAALSMYWLARTERLNVPASVAVGVLFSALPGHQTRYAHLFLAAYWVVPFGVWVALRVARGRPVFTPTASDEWGRQHRRQWAVRSSVIVIFVALGGVYHSAFALILIAVALALRMLSRYRREELYRGLLVLFAVSAVTATSLLSMHLRTLKDAVVGSDPLGRSPADSERYGGKIVDLLLPWPEHRIPALGQVAQRYDAATQTTFEPSSLGILPVLGCAVVVISVLTLGMSSRSWGRRVPDLWLYGVMTMVATAFYTKDGLGAIFALAVSPGIRTWLRLYVVIGLFGLLAVGRLLSTVGVRFGRVAGVCAAGVVLLLGVLDQTSPNAAPRYEANRAQLAAVTSVTSRLEASLPSGCAVFQLPVVRFPDGPPTAKLGYYDLELPYLASTQLRWSFGAVQSTTASEWQTRLPADPAALSDDLAAAGFCAVLVDTQGYEQPASILSQLTRELGQAAATSTDSRLVAFDLRERRSELEARLGADATAMKGFQVLHPFAEPSTTVGGGSQ
jgi:hypothetical protein